MTHLRRGDTDLHRPDGTHITTSPSTSGHMIEQFERRISAHLAEHKGNIKERSDERIEANVTHDYRSERSILIDIEGLLKDTIERLDRIEARLGDGRWM